MLDKFLLLPAIIGGGSIGVILQATVPESVPLVPALLTGMLTMQCWQITKSYSMQRKLDTHCATFEECMKHLPTKHEVSEEIKETRHAVSNKIQACYSDVIDLTAKIDDRIRKLEKGD